MSVYSFSPEQIAQFRSAKPFPHLVVDNFISSSIAEHVAEEIESLPDSAWKWKTAGDGRTLHKGSISDREKCPVTSWDALLAVCTNPWRLETLRDLTGIENLQADPGLPEHAEGGGFHRIDPGGRLGIHVDFNTLKDRPTWRRRLNLLLYLNRDWDEKWGGSLELWDCPPSKPFNPWDILNVTSPSMKCVNRILPLFNRAVLFETSDHSWHGHPEPLACPPGRKRISMAAYMYTNDAVEPHRTTQYR